MKRSSWLVVFAAVVGLVLLGCGGESMKNPVGAPSGLSGGGLRAAKPVARAESLGPASDLTLASGSGCAVGGVGLFTQPGRMTVNVPAGAAVRQALLYWEGQHSAPDNGDNTIRLNGVEITGDVVGGPTLFFLAYDGEHYTTSYRADITGLGMVGPGMNTFAVDGLSFGFDPPRNNGAGMFVIYDDGSGLHDIQVMDGNDCAYRYFAPPLDATVPQTFTFAPASASRMANLSLFVGSVSDGRPRPNAIDITTGGVTTRLVNALSSAQGLEWDALTLPFTVPAGASDLTVQLFSHDDGSGNQPASLTWVTVTLCLPLEQQPPPPPPPSLMGRMTGGGSVFTADGMRVTHGFELHCDYTDLPNNLEVNWKGNRFHMETLTSATCTDDPTIAPDPPPAGFDTYHGTGAGRYNGASGATAEWTFTDAGEPGKYDHAEITIKDADGNVVLYVSGYLHFGNHQAHRK